VGNDAKVANVFAIQFSHRSRSVCKLYGSSLIRWLQAAFAAVSDLKINRDWGRGFTKMRQ
jgi:hypothetical protein